MKFIDSLLNRITMYRLVVYGLIIVDIAGIVLAAIGRLSISPVSLIASLSLLLSTCYLTDLIMSRVWRAPFNHESWLITALIIFLILRPPRTVAEAIATGMAGVIACASKYILVWRSKHIFNPAALSAGLLGISGLQIVSWWVGNSALWPLTLVVGLAVIRKLRRITMVTVFVVTSVVLQAILLLHAHQAIAIGLQHALLASPLIFLSTIMLTEPATMPPRLNQQIIFAGIIAVFYIMAWRVGPIYTYPEVALLLGNVYAFIVSPKFKVRMRLMQIQKISSQVYNYVFLPDQNFAFQPGQYLELTLPHVRFDSRGNRRTFTIASSPTEENVQLGVKFYSSTSTYKYALSRLRPGDSVFASQLAGSFTLEGNEQKKLAFIAGGIGITPFRSMLKYLTDQNIACDIVLVYIVSKPEELAYKPELVAAKKLGARIVPVLSRTDISAPGMISSELNRDLIAWAVPDYIDRMFYVSGPHNMVSTAKSLLRSMQVRHIKTDYFSGY